ncbi:hypothetical protein [Tellurirhabdus bombi]|uniref:hypothetical protein n=1 Tax=Tellurirhabdus bombi TaxID=2907205 RepID=UPI001F24528B|nr:hypothetical protein [Tellurirhabdus bombi]
MRRITHGLLLLILVAGVSCKPYERLVRKYGKEVTDTLRVTVRDTIRIEKDSVVLAYRNDAAPFTRTVKQGRATLTITKRQAETTAEAECQGDTIYINKTVEVPVKTTYIGVDPGLLRSAERKAQSWMYSTIALAAVVVLMAIAFLFSRFFRISVTRK